MSNKEHPIHTRRHAQPHEHHAVAEESAHFVDDAPATSDPAPTDAQLRELATALQLTGPEVAQFLATRPPTADQLAAAPKVNTVAIARAWTPESVAALGASGIALPGTSATELTHTAHVVGLAASFASKARAAATRADQSARGQAELLDTVLHKIHEQVAAKSNADDTSARAFSGLNAYWKHAYPGHSGAAKKDPSSGSGTPTGGH